MGGYIFCVFVVVCRRVGILKGADDLLSLGEGKQDYEIDLEAAIANDQM